MSEYQYYEFQAIDRPLTPEEQQAVAELSSRVGPHPWRATFTYSFGGSLYRRAENVLAEYYDAMLYLANWGSRQLMFRFPKSLVDPDRMRQYNVETTDPPADIVQVDVKGKYVVLNIELNEEDGLGWIEGEGWLGSLVGLREAILQGDYRALYLAWLKGTTSVYGVDEDALEPPVPPGLGKLTPALRNFVELFDVDADTLQAAAEQSAPLESRTLTEDDLRQAIETLSPEEKDDFLLRLVQGEPQLSLALKRRLGVLGDSLQYSTGPRRTVSEILAAAAGMAERRRKAKAAAAEAQRIAEMEALARRGDNVWNEVDALIQQGQAKPYNEAVQLLKKLRDLAEHRRQTVAFQTRLNRIYSEYSRRSSLMRRLRDAGLTKSEV
ncbi:MAG: hypothetical protein DRJ03_31210 [Chloroflexi bacterium]|nr:MAG: hypothetical protein DRJ03_31210 [Chloroflexota bacterium]